LPIFGVRAGSAIGFAELSSELIPIKAAPKRTGVAT
jgi:predicted transporter